MSAPGTACNSESRKRNAAAPADASIEAEADAWDEFYDTDAARCCSCPSCNFYAPDYEQHKDDPCVLRTLIERIITARIEATR